MNLLHNDIIIRNFKDGETIWLSQRLIIDVCGITEVYLKDRARRLFKKSIQRGYKYGDFLPNTGTAWRWGRANGTFYYDFDCLPDRKPTHYRSKFGTKADLKQAYNDFIAAQNNNKQGLISQIISNQVNTFIDNTDTVHFMYKELVEPDQFFEIGRAHV